VVRKPALLVLIGVALFGCLGGLVAAMLRTPSYSADALVVVYEMPHDQRELVGPDAANQLDDFYSAGALQPTVAQHVLAQFPGMTNAQLRAAVQISIIAYTPLTRVTATASTPQRAIDIANAVAVQWTALADDVNSQAWTTTVDTLKAQEHDLNTQIATTQQAIADAQAAGATMSALQAQLTVQLQALAKTDYSLINLDQLRLVMTNNASVATPADTNTVTRSPDVLKLVAEGGAGGLALGFLFALWLLHRQRSTLATEGKPRAEVALAGVATGDAYDGR
jgi:capsular polysaccharide biosynthesis protein